MSSYICTMGHVAKEGDIVILETIVPQQIAVHEIHAPPEIEDYWVLSIEINGAEQLVNEVPGDVLAKRVTANKPLPYPLFILPARARVKAKVRVKTDAFFTLCFCQYSSILVGLA